MEENNQEPVVEDNHDEELAPLGDLLHYLTEDDLNTGNDPAVAHQKLYELTDRFNALVFRTHEALQDNHPATEQVPTADSNADVEAAANALFEARREELTNQYNEMGRQLEESFVARERALNEEHQRRELELNAHLDALRDENAHLASAQGAEQPVSTTQARLNRIVEETAQRSNDYLNDIVEQVGTVVVEAQAEAAQLLEDAHAEAEKIVADAQAHADKLVADATEEANTAIQHRNQAVASARDIFDRFGGLFAHQQREFLRHGEDLTESPLLALDAGQRAVAIEATPAEEVPVEDVQDAVNEADEADQPVEQDEDVAGEEVQEEAPQDAHQEVRWDAEEHVEDAEEEGWPTVDSAPTADEEHEGEGDRHNDENRNEN